MTALSPKEAQQVRIKNDFAYHKPDADSIPKFAAIRAELQTVALHLTDLAPAGRELSTALTKLEEAMFWANAAIARQLPIE